MVGEPPPFWQQDPTGRFTGRARDYTQGRPSYPAKAIRAILEGLGDPATLVAADVGAGTGIASRLLADQGVTVLAVEPNAAMRAAATPHPRVTAIDGTGERTGLADGQVALVLCAQSFHWFEPRAALAELRRVLAPEGRLALLWNVRDDHDAVTAAYSRLVREAAGDRLTEAHGEGVEALLPEAGFRDVRVLSFTFEQAVDAAGLRARAASASYVPAEGPAREALERGLRALHAESAGPDGRLRLVYRTTLYLARRG